VKGVLRRIIVVCLKTSIEIVNDIYDFGIINLLRFRVKDLGNTL